MDPGQQIPDLGPASHPESILAVPGPEKGPQGPEMPEARPPRLVTTRGGLGLCADSGRSPPARRKGRRRARATLEQQPPPRCASHGRLAHRRGRAVCGGLPEGPPGLSEALLLPEDCAVHASRRS
ncbi:unnamed protein product [Prorocentrum cordatum]|uniref:Uncharacterized protein n=1 Tax=Prorocentrum cordatum TaxID=2364126 RepID=A0ABN9SY88_9DINO|nr:unnamed protein product [Polarella glacialis]